MEAVIKGKVWTFGDDIDTDQIYPGRYLELTDHKEIAKHVMEGVDSSFAGEFAGGGIIVAGENFGCGSSREHAVIALKNAGAAAVIARSFARIFYRNAINLGLPVVTCDGILEKVGKGDEVTIDLRSGRITNMNNQEAVQGDRLPEHVMAIIEKGGIIPLFRERMRDRA